MAFDTETCLHIKQLELEVIKRGGMARIHLALISDEGGLPFRKWLAFTLNNLGQMFFLYVIFWKLIPFSHYFNYYVRPTAI